MEEEKWLGETRGDNNAVYGSITYGILKFESFEICDPSIDNDDELPNKQFQSSLNREHFRKLMAS